MNNLTQEELIQELHYNNETGIFTRARSSSSNAPIGSVAGYITQQGYIAIRVKGVEYKAHRLAWLYVYGQFPAHQLDHINRDKSDNRISNLREATIQENQQNVGLRKDNKSGYAGVHWSKKLGKWTARIRVSGKRKYLGLFDNIDDAIKARRNAEMSYHPFKTTKDVLEEGRT